jgi:vacuolar-type H+-ATPase subunit I/STV1
VPLIDGLVLVATVLAFVTLLPQVLRLRRTRNPAGVSLPWAALAAVTNLGWGTHLLREELWAGVWSCVGAALTYALVAGQLVALHVPWRPVVAPVMGWAALLAGSTVLDATTGTGLLGPTLALGFAVQVTPAVVAAWRDPVPVGVSPTTWLLTLVQVLLWGIYGATHRDTGVMLLGVLGGLASGAMLLRWWLTRAAVARRLAVAATT